MPDYLIEPDWAHLAARDITSHAQHYCMGDIEKIAKIIREKHRAWQISQCAAQQQFKLPPGCVSGGPEGIGEFVHSGAHDRTINDPDVVSWIYAERERCAKICERLEAEETASEGFATIDSFRYEKAAEEIRKGTPVTPDLP